MHIRMRIHVPMHDGRAGRHTYASWVCVSSGRKQNRIHALVLWVYDDVPYTVYKGMAG